MPSDKIIDSRLFISLDFSDTQKINKSFSQNGKNKAHLASQLLLYEQIVIPTIDYGIIPTLISWLGVNEFIQSLDSGSISFIRRHGMLVYNGGQGLRLIKIDKGEKSDFSWWQEALFGKDEVSLELQLKHNLPMLSTNEQKLITQKVLKNTSQLEFKDNLFNEMIVKESYKDVMKSPSLYETFKKYAKKSRDGNIYLERLEEVQPNETRILKHNYEITDVVDLVLRVAEINMEIAMSTQSSNADLFTSDGADNILRQKVFRANLPQRLTNGFVSLLDLKRMPDIRPAVENGEVPLSTIWKIRQSSKGRNFRDWLKKADPKSAIDLTRAYIEAIEKDTPSDSLPLRALRFAVTSALGVINPIVGLGGSVIDSFFVDKWINGYSPKLLFDELQKLNIYRGKKNV